MTGTEFMNNCSACGGNWAAMLMSGVKKAFPEYWENLKDKEYSFDDIYAMTVECGVDWDK